MEDTAEHQRYRAQLIESLRRKGIYNEIVLLALSKVPRHWFIPAGRSLQDMYADMPLAIGQQQTISQPFTVAYQTQLLEVRPGHKILEIGTGSGYHAAILANLGAEVYTIERQELLFRETQQRLHTLHYTTIHMTLGDGNLGFPEQAPYDRVLVTAAAPEVPQLLLEQLKIGGIMVVPVDGHLQRLLKIIKLSDTKIQIQDCGSFRFVPMLPGIVMGMD